MELHGGGKIKAEIERTRQTSSSLLHWIPTNSKAVSQRIRPKVIQYEHWNLPIIPICPSRAVLSTHWAMTFHIACHLKNFSWCCRGLYIEVLTFIHCYQDPRDSVDPNFVMISMFVYIIGVQVLHASSDEKFWG